VSKTRRTALILVNAIIWVAVLIGAAVVLQGTGYLVSVLPILIAGAAVSITVVVRSTRRIEAQ
jgi:hypothetical protein